MLIVASEALKKQIRKNTKFKKKENRLNSSVLVFRFLLFLLWRPFVLIFWQTIEIFGNTWRSNENLLFFRIGSVDLECVFKLRELHLIWDWKWAGLDSYAYSSLSTYLIIWGLGKNENSTGLVKHEKLFWKSVTKQLTEKIVFFHLWFKIV